MASFQKSPTPPCLRMVDIALLAGYPQYTQNDIYRNKVIQNITRHKPYE